MSRSEPDVDWARTMEFSTPLRWGEVEAAILSRPAPSLGGQYTGPMTARRALGVSGVVRFVVLGVAIGAAPAIGLGLVVAHVHGALGDEVVRWAFYCQVAAASLLLLAVLEWTEERRRGSRSSLALVAETAVTSTASYFVLRTSSDQETYGSLPRLALGTAVAGWILLLVVGFGSRRWVRYTRPRDRPDQTEQGAGYMGARVAVIEILIRRGLVDRGDVDITEMMEMPLGTWRDLDPD